MVIMWGRLFWSESEVSWSYGRCNTPLNDHTLNNIHCKCSTEKYEEDKTMSAYLLHCLTACFVFSSTFSHQLLLLWKGCMMYVNTLWKAFHFVCLPHPHRPCTKTPPFQFRPANQGEADRLTHILTLKSPSSLLNSRKIKSISDMLLLHIPHKSGLCLGVFSEKPQRHSEDVSSISF